MLFSRPLPKNAFAGAHLCVQMDGRIAFVTLVGRVPGFSASVVAGATGRGEVGVQRHTLDMLLAILLPAQSLAEDLAHQATAAAKCTSQHRMGGTWEASVPGETAS